MEEKASFSDEVEATTILITGNLSQPCQDKDEPARRAIEILQKVSRDNPRYLLKAIQDAVEIRVDGMAMVALAILTANAPDSFFQHKKIPATIVSILSFYGPPKLLEYVELLKCKGFGRGFGSRPQKWVRAVMESWSIKNFENYIDNYTIAFYSLLRLVHPRYTGIRGGLIKEILSKS